MKSAFSLLGCLFVASVAASANVTSSPPEPVTLYVKEGSRYYRVYIHKLSILEEGFYPVFSPNGYYEEATFTYNQTSSQIQGDTPAGSLALGYNELDLFEFGATSEKVVIDDAKSVSSHKFCAKPWGGEKFLTLSKKSDFCSREVEVVLRERDAVVDADGSIVEEQSDLKASDKVAMLVDDGGQLWRITSRRAGQKIDGEKVFYPKFGYIKQKSNALTNFGFGDEDQKSLKRKNRHNDIMDVGISPQGELSQHTQAKENPLTLNYGKSYQLEGTDWYACSDSKSEFHEIKTFESTKGLKNCHAVKLRIRKAEKVKKNNEGQGEKVLD